MTVKKIPKLMAPMDKMRLGFGVSKPEMKAIFSAQMGTAICEVRELNTYIIKWQRTRFNHCE